MTTLVAVLIAAATASAGTVRAVPAAGTGASASGASYSAGAPLFPPAPALSPLLSAPSQDAPRPELPPAAQPKVLTVPPSRAAERHVPRHDGLILGALADPAKELAGLTVRLYEWQYFSFAVVTDDETGLGEAVVNGAPAADSELEHKHVVRELVEDGKRRYRHDYGWLALGRTPEGAYAISFPDKGLAFAATVTQLDKSTPEQRAASMKRMVQEVFDEKKPEEAFGAGVPEAIRAFMGPHRSLVGGMLPDYEAYVREDPTLDEPGRAARLLELEGLREFHREISEGRSRYTTLSPVVAQLLARERSIVEDYKRYLNDDVGVGKTAGGFHIEQIDRYRAIMTQLREVYAEAERQGEPGAFAKAVGKAVELWARLRVWLATRRWL